MFISSRRRWLAVIIVVMVATGVGVITWWLDGDEPAAVDAERAVSEDSPIVIGAESATEASERAAPPSSADDLTGTWVVDASRTFDRASGRGTFVGYRIDEELAGIGATTAVGRTPDVDGHLTFERTRLVDVRIVADLARLVSDDSRRDRRVATMFADDPQAVFVLDDTIDLGEVPAIGEVIEVQVAGLLTIGGVTQPVTVRIEAALTEVGMVVAGSTHVLLGDFGVAVPSASIVLSASDEAAIEWQLYLMKE